MDLDASDLQGDKLDWEVSFSLKVNYAHILKLFFFYIRNNNILCVESFNLSVLTDISPNKVGGLVIVQ